MSDAKEPSSISLYSAPLYSTAKFLQARAAEGDSESLEVLQAVNYHVDAAAEAARRCWSLAGDTDVILMGKTPPELNRSQSLKLLRSGDEAVREAVSAVDTALQAVNHLLKLGIPSHKVTPDRVLAILGNAKATGTQPHREQLSTAIQAVVRSMMLAALRAYRNWVTHRGAPTIAAAGTNSDDWPPDRTLSLDHLEVICYPFIPPVLTRRLRGSIQIPQLSNPAPIRLSDGRVAFPMFQIELCGGQMVVGGLEMDADQYAAKNPERIEIRRVKLAGEELAVYRARDFVRGVEDLVSRLQMNLAEGAEWDNAFAALIGPE